MKRLVSLVVAAACLQGCGHNAGGLGGKADGASPPGDGGGDLASAPADGAIGDGAVIDAGDLGPPVEYPWTYGPPPAPDDWFSAAPACSDADWLAKYFVYRRRYRGDGTADNPGFLAIGLGPGRSLPAGVRIPTVDCKTHWLTSGCQQDTIPNARGNLHFGDTTIWLGWYLSTLGTEHRAFKLLGIDTTETERDLYYALSAFNRLDEVAETYFSGYAPARDGFFKRDDVPVGMIWKDNPSDGLRFPRKDGFDGYQCLSSGTTCAVVTTTADGYFMSQDQVIEMLPGLAAVAKLVDPTVEVDGMNLAHEAQEITHRVTKFLRDRDWVIKDPTGESPPNQWGGTALPYSNQIAKGANFITGNAFGISDYRNTLSETVGATLTGAVDVGWELQTLNNQAMVLALVTVSDEWGGDKLAQRAADWNAPYYPLLNAVLYGHGFPTGVSETEVESMLSSAPCKGPCHNTAGCEEHAGWQGEHRWKSPEERSGSRRGLDGEFTGLDYMVLHNLYVIAKAGKTQVQWTPAPTSCSGTEGTLAKWMTTPPQPGDTYDPWSECNRADFDKMFCGRPFAGWLDAAYHGKVYIHFPGVRLRCEGSKPCVAEAATEGTNYDDLFIGSPGPDTFAAYGGADCLMGFGGDDVLEGGAGRDELWGGDGNDTLCGEGCSMTDVDGDPDVLYGEAGDDDMSGGPSTDVLYGGPGNDTMHGNGSFDFLYGGPGNDRMYGDFGNDIMSGDEDNDTMYGGEGRDIMYGGPGRDKLDGQMGDDVLHGEDGDDFLMGGEGADILYGAHGSDRLCGGCGEDNLNGGTNWDGVPEADSCRGDGAGLFGCIPSTSNTVNECEGATASKDECLDPAFDAW